LNGAAAHAFAHILYKALLFMGAGAVLHVTGLRKLSDMGGLYKTMPITLALYMVGAFAISAVPLFSGFVSKAMIVSAAGESHMAAIFLLLTLASSGTFLHTGLKLPYYMFFGPSTGSGPSRAQSRDGKDRRIRAKEPPSNMLVAMGLAAAACVLIGVIPAMLYSYLPYPADYAPYTARHVMATLGLLGFTALGFFLMLKHLDPEPIVSLDTDWFYRRGGSAVQALAAGGLARAERLVGQISGVVVQWQVFAAASGMRQLDARVIDATATGVGRLTQALSQVLSRAVSGHAQYYALLMAAGVLAAISFAVFAS
jgi:multicomponent Na+:H+ antiporter subunit D